MTAVLVLIDPAASTIEITDLASPQLPVDDLSAHRGDGIFETVLVRVEDSPASQSQAPQSPAAPSQASTVVSRNRHFERFQGSAAALDLPAPDRELWDRALDAVIEQTLAASPGLREFGVRYSYSRGLDAPRGWAFAVPVSDAIERARANGVRAISLDRGYDAHIGEAAPWLLIGAKTISYAVNQAAGRHAAAQGVDEALFVSHDGVVLEGPTANIVIRRGHRLLTPDPAAGLLSGTTQRLLFDHAAEFGLKAEYADLSIEDVLTAHGAWYVSSIRSAVALTELDGIGIAVDAELTSAFQQIVRKGHIVVARD